MRFLIKFKLKEDKKIINGFSYIGGVISFLKSVFGEEFFSKKEFRPYVWSIYFGKEFKVQKDSQINVPKTIDFIFSTGNYQIATMFWNGILNWKLSKNSVKISDINYEIDWINLLPLVKVNKKNIKFKTLGPIVLTDDKNGERTFQSWYIPSQDEYKKFEEIVNLTLSKKYEIFMRKKITMPMRIVSISKIKTVVIPYKNGYLKGFKCEFEAESDPKILQFVYDYGIGIRNGQGFGMLEIIKG